MPTYSEQWNAQIAYKAQSAVGTPATGSGGTVLRTTGGAGGSMTKQAIESMEVRRDGLSTRGRHGSQRTAGSYQGEYSVGSMDQLLAAIMRADYSAADLTITQATMTSITTTSAAGNTGTIVAAAGSWITQGIRVGDIIRLTGHSTAANNSRNLRVTAVTATVLSIATLDGAAFTADAVADTSFSVVRPGRVLVNPAAGALVKKYFTFDEHEYAIDGSELFYDTVINSLGLSVAPDGLLNWTLATIGTGKFDAFTAGSAPSLTTPTMSTGVPLAATEMVLRIGSTDQVDLTAFDISLDLQAQAPPIIGRYAPDVFQGSLQVALNMTGLRSDLQRVLDFQNETVLSAHVVSTENAAEPKSFLSIYVPEFTLGQATKSALAKAGGPRTTSFQVPAALVGVDGRGGAYDATMVKMQVSNAA